MTRTTLRDHKTIFTVYVDVTSYFHGDHLTLNRLQLHPLHADINYLPVSFMLLSW